LIANLHGFWIPESKEDTPERLEQSDKIIKFLDSYKHGKILCGDFNLNPNTKSMFKLEEEMVNLVKKHNVKSTRSGLHTRKDKFADYILVSKDIKVLDFKVLQDQVSDHLPLFLEFD
jgi:endonuclease/exonuclease/phosphatase family metal-dependent hydrolase